ncbi:hypothetical protein, partial [Phocaeicola vulgatus]|uniref:hypothetical protein n=1 Tax=Phocaeicola vulgatus TaxID=821 RepID=UPI001C86D5DE
NLSRSSLLYINPKIFVRSEDRDFNYEPIFDCLPKNVSSCRKVSSIFSRLYSSSEAIYPTFANRLLYSLALYSA